MTSVLEGQTQGPPLQAALAAGLRTISDDQTITFGRYQRYVLPLDGYVFWLRTMQTAARGSLHISTDKRQNEDETIAINRVVFSTTTSVQAFDDIGPNVIWVGEWGGSRFAFTRKESFYQAASLFHYAGDAVYPALESQLVDNGAQFPPDTLIISNSLPAWLAIQSYAPFWLAPKNPGITLYPSFLVPNNLRPPYGAVHIDPAGTQSLQGKPWLDLVSTHQQLAQDQVRVTLYGATNAMAADFYDTVNRYSIDTDVIGMMNTPIIRDEKRTQAELGILAMKKTLLFTVSYNQTRINDVAQQLIEQATATFSSPSN